MAHQAALVLVALFQKFEEFNGCINEILAVAIYSPNPQLVVDRNHIRMYQTNAREKMEDFANRVNLTIDDVFEFSQDLTAFIEWYEDY
jgi:hypothetical protein